MTDAGSNDTIQGTSVGDTGRSPSADSPLGRGDLVGRYVVLDRLGAGAMGVVYAAFDPELDRKIALKLVHPSEEEGTGGQARLLREAQALAKLSHPHVVAVHDVGALGERVWIAMELVAGKTLRAWLDEGRHPWAEVLAMIMAAGRGLAAAHATGLVHRDFKPDNVMIGDDGRVRVMDFGLARPVENARERTLDSVVDDEGAQASRKMLDAALTRAGTLAGTPAYMSPEQFLGDQPDARADQFALCVTLWEGLHGERPFRGETLLELVTEVLEGQLHPPPRDVSVPTWLRRVVTRGLAREPEQRWTTTDALLHELSRGHSRARRARLLAVASAIVLAGVGTGVMRELAARARASECERAGSSIERLWNDARRVAVRDALVATGVSYAPKTADSVQFWLDQQSDAWRRARTDVCLDADVRGVSDAAALDRSLWCLDEREMELDALVAELLRADATSVQHAVTAAAGLSQVHDCREVVLLERLPALPVERREEIRAARAGLSRAGALDRTGRYGEGLEVARSVREHAASLEWPPLSAAARAVEAKLLGRQGLYDQAEGLAADAYFEAARVGAWDIATDLASELVFVVGDRSARHADGLAWGRHAEVALEHAGDPDTLREAGLVGNLAGVTFGAGDLAKARALYERAIEILEKALGPDHPDVAMGLHNLALVHDAAGNYPEARALHERALATWEAALGPDHPDIAMSLTNLALVHYATGEHERARALYERALGIMEQLGPDHPNVAVVLNNLANVHEATGALAQARALHRRALAIREKALGADHPEVAISLGNLGNLHRGLGETADARLLYERALAIQERALGPDHPDVGRTLYNLGVLQQLAGDDARARPLYERALALHEKALGPEHPQVAIVLANLASVLEGAGDHERALALYERAVTIFEGHAGDQEGEAATRFAFAQSLARNGGDRLAERGEHAPTR